VIATVSLAYQSGGATVAEALCLANATASGKTAVNEAFYTPTKAQSRRMVSCVGSDARFRRIVKSISFEKLPRAPGTP
jgi:hypothetical protein